MILLFMDLETTGLDPTRHRVIEIAVKAINSTTGEVVGSYETVVKQPYEVWERRDSFSIEVNGFQWNEVSKGMEEADVGHFIVGLFKQWGIERGKAVYVCQNPAFDRSFFAQLVDLYTQERLKWPYHWLDFASMYWAMTVQNCVEKNMNVPVEISLSKDEIAKRYNLPPEKKPHRARNGVDHLIVCYNALFQNARVEATASWQ